MAPGFLFYFLLGDVGGHLHLGWGSVSAIDAGHVVSAADGEHGEDIATVIDGAAHAAAATPGAGGFGVEADAGDVTRAAVEVHGLTCACTDEELKAGAFVAVQGVLAIAEDGLQDDVAIVTDTHGVDGAIGEAAGVGGCIAFTGQDFDLACLSDPLAEDTVRGGGGSTEHRLEDDIASGSDVEVAKAFWGEACGEVGGAFASDDDGGSLHHGGQDLVIGGGDATACFHEGGEGVVFADAARQAIDGIQRAAACDEIALTSDDAEDDFILLNIGAEDGLVYAECRFSPWYWLGLAGVRRRRRLRYHRRPGCY